MVEEASKTASNNINEEGKLKFSSSPQKASSISGNNVARLRLRATNLEPINPTNPYFVKRREVTSMAMRKFLNSIAALSENTASAYRRRLFPFDDFIKSYYGAEKTPDSLILDLKELRDDPYDVLSAYAVYLKTNKERKISDNYVRELTKMARQFLEYHRIVITERQFRSSVRLPRYLRRDKAAIDKSDIRQFMIFCKDLSVRTYMLTLASTGMRAAEALSLRLSDLDFNQSPGKINIRAEFTKMRTDRYIYMTEELRRHLEEYVKIKYRPRYRVRVNSETGKKGKYISHPKARMEDLLFAPMRWDDSNMPEPKIISMYKSYARRINTILDGCDKGDRELHSGFRKITRHSFRRFVKSTISDLGYADFSEWYIGHLASTYYRKKENERIEIFRKIEPYLTFLDIASLEASKQDLVTQLEMSRKETIELSRRLEHVEKSQEEQNKFIRENWKKFKPHKEDGETFSNSDPSP